MTPKIRVKGVPRPVPLADSVSMCSKLRQGVSLTVTGLGRAGPWLSEGLKWGASPQVALSLTSALTLPACTKYFCSSRLEFLLDLVLDPLGGHTG